MALHVFLVAIDAAWPGLSAPPPRGRLSRGRPLRHVTVGPRRPPAAGLVAGTPRGLSVSYPQGAVWARRARAAAAVGGGRGGGERAGGAGAVVPTLQSTTWRARCIYTPRNPLSPGPASPLPVGSPAGRTPRLSATHVTCAYAGRGGRPVPILQPAAQPPVAHGGCNPLSPSSLAQRPCRDPRPLTLDGGHLATWCITSDLVLSHPVLITAPCDDTLVSSPPSPLPSASGHLDRNTDVDGTAAARVRSSCCGSRCVQTGAASFPALFSPCFVVVRSYGLHHHPPRRWVCPTIANAGGGAHVDNVGGGSDTGAASQQLRVAPVWRALVAGDAVHCGCGTYFCSLPTGRGRGRSSGHGCSLAAVCCSTRISVCVSRGEGFWMWR